VKPSASGRRHSTYSNCRRKEYCHKASEKAGAVSVNPKGEKTSSYTTDKERGGISGETK